MNRRATSLARPAPVPLDPIGVGHDAIGVVDVVLPVPDPFDDDETAEIEAVVDENESSRGDDAAEWLVRRFLALCENPRTRDRALRLVRASSAGGRGGRAVYGLVNRVVVNPVARACGIETSALKVELVVAQLVGLATMRYVLEVEPIASADTEELVRRTAPGIAALLAG